MKTRVLVISGASPNANDAVGDFAWLLSKQIAREHRVSFLGPVAPEVPDSSSDNDISVLRVSGGWGIPSTREVLRAAERIKADLILVHFVPQLYGWNGAKPFFAMLLRKLKHRGFPIVTVAHEFSAPFGPSPKLALWSIAHRILLRVIVAASGSIIMTNSLYAQILKRTFPDRAGDIYEVPVGCTLPVTPREKRDCESLRHEYGLQPEELVVATFGSSLESSAAQVAAFLNTICSGSRRVHCLIIGKSGSSLREKLLDGQTSQFRVTSTGEVTGQRASDLLAISDLYVALFPDGASTRRTSLMAGLANGVPTISNKGLLTESLIASSGAVLLMNGASNDVLCLRQLAESDERRRELGARGLRFFEENFSWETIGQRYAQIINGTLVR